MKERTLLHEYFEINELPIGDLPYSAIQKALKDEKYMRKFTPSFCRQDLQVGNLSALLYWYPYYILQLYELASEGKEYRCYFRGLPIEIVEAFNYLFPELINRLDKAKKIIVELTVLDEIKIKRR